MFLVNYVESDSIWSFNSNVNEGVTLSDRPKWKQDKLVIDHTTVTPTYYRFPPDPANPNLLSDIRMVRFQSVVLTRIRQPVTLIEALAKIGGLLVVLKLSIFLILIYEYLFERHLLQELNNTKPYDTTDTQEINVSQ